MLRLIVELKPRPELRSLDSAMIKTTAYLKELQDLGKKSYNEKNHHNDLYSSKGSSASNVRS